MKAKVIYIIATAALTLSAFFTGKFTAPRENHTHRFIRKQKKIRKLLATMKIKTKGGKRKCFILES